MRGMVKSSSTAEIPAARPPAPARVRAGDEAFALGERESEESRAEAR